MRGGPKTAVKDGCVKIREGNMAYKTRIEAIA